MKKEKAGRAIFLITGVILIFIIGISFSVGKYELSIREIIRLLCGQQVEGMGAQVLFTLRIPRTFMAVLGGAGLGLAGFAYQSVFKNPLASPDIIGIASGANLGAAVVIVAMGTAVVNVAVGAFVGGLVAVMFVMLVAQATHSNMTSTYVLSGIIISSIAQAVIMLLKYCADSESELASIEYWTMGSLSAVTAGKVMAVLPFWLVGFAGVILLRRQIELLSLNEEECRALGVRLGSIRRCVLILSTLLVASIICVTGLISFIGLIAPHIARLLLKRQNSVTMFLSALVGAVVLLTADILARLLPASELPVSILTTIIGVPILVWFMCKRREGHL